MKKRELDWGSRIALAFFAVVLVMIASGCAHANGKLVLTEDAVHDGLAKLDDKVTTFCTGNATYAAPCHDANDPMKALLKAGDAFNRSVAAQKVSGLGTLLTAGGDVVKAFQKLPQGQTAEWIKELAAILASANAQVAGGQ